MQLKIGAGAPFEGFIFALQAAGFEGPPHDQYQPVRIEGFLDILVSAALDGSDSRFNIAVTRNDDNGDVLMLFLDDLQEIETIQFRAL